MGIKLIKTVVAEYHCERCARVDSDEKGCRPLGWGNVRLEWHEAVTDVGGNPTGGRFNSEDSHLLCPDCVMAAGEVLHQFMKREVWVGAGNKFEFGDPVRPDRGDEIRDETEALDVQTQEVPEAPQEAGGARAVPGGDGAPAQSGHEGDPGPGPERGQLPPEAPRGCRGSFHDREYPCELCTDPMDCGSWGTCAATGLSWI